MAMSASPPPSLAASRHDALSEQLDEDIAKVRAEIQALSQRRKLLSASLLSTSQVQACLRSRNIIPSTSTNNNASVNSIPQDPNPLLSSQLQHNETNIHRLAYGVTSFPFTDPNPETSNEPLLGVRIEIPSRNGKFERSPYYVFLKRRSPSLDLEVHHHTVPALVPIDTYVAKYLPLSSTLDNGNVRERISGEGGRDEGYYGSNSSGATSPDRNHTAGVPSRDSDQDLHAFVDAIRNDLVSWHLRQDTLSWLNEELNLPHSIQNDGDMSTQDDVPLRREGKYSLVSLTPTGVDHRYVKLLWKDGMVGRVKISDDGYVERAAVFAEERMREVEKILTDARGSNEGRLRLRDLGGRLQEVDNKMTKRRQSELSDDNNDDDGDTQMTTAESEADDEETG